MRLFLFGDVVRCGSVPVNDAKTPHETERFFRKAFFPHPTSPIGFFFLE